MSRKYWTGIFVAMLAIFVVGMLVARGVNKFGSLVDDNLPSPWKLMTSAGFRVDGDRIGDIQRLQFMRSTPGQYDSAVVSVKIDDSADVQRIANCTLRATNAHPFAGNTRFVCVSHSDSARLNLIPFGHIVVMPEGKIVTFYVASSTEQDMRQSAYRGTGGSDSGDVDISVTDGSFRITVNGQELVNASDSAGLTVRDANGREIVRIGGDSNGGSVQVTGHNGKKIVNIHGTSSKKTPNQ